MTDTRLPEHFLTSPTLDGLTSDAFRVYVNGLMWSVTHGTDGLLPERALRYLHPDGKRPDVAAELTTTGLWEHDDDGHHVPDFLKYQTPAAQIEKARTADRERKQRERQQRLDQPPPTSELSVSDGTSDRTADRSHGGFTEDRTETGHAAVKRGTYGTFVGAEAEHEQPDEPVGADPLCYACRTSNPAGSTECGYCHNNLSGDGSPRLRAVTS